MAKRRLSKPWAKLDFDFFEDEAVMLLEKRSVRDAYNWVKLVALWADFPDARIDFNDEGTVLKLRAKLGMGEDALRAFFDRLAELGLVEPEFWSELGVVTNERAAMDADRRQRQRSGGAKGGGAKASLQAS